MSSILSLGYNDLSPTLRTCLLYLCLFPKDHVIDRERLVWRWISEGFISKERGLSKKEVAENYFYELINKSPVQPVGIRYDGKVRACQVHDMMLEIIISKSAEDNFTTVVGGGQTSLENRQGFLRRLSIQHIDKELAAALANEDLNHVRSLIVTTSCCIKHLPSLVQFEALRVLDFEGVEDLEDYDMNGIESLFQLKYLSFRNTGISKLPSGIVMLFNLVTLNLGNTRVQELPTGFARLTKLQHLVGRNNKIPNGIGDMRKLQLMSGFVITSSETDALEDLGNLTSLEVLQVWLSTGVYSPGELSCEDKRCEEAFLSSLCKLGTCKLRSLDISTKGASLHFLDSWFPLPSSLQMFRATSTGSFKNFPKWITPALTNLADVQIDLTELTEDGLLTLGKLPSLLRLVLWSSEKFVTTVQGIYFPSLKMFNLSSSSLYVTFAKGSMPKLENLELSFSVSVAKANDFYSGIQHLPCLKKAYILLRNEDTTPSESKAAAAVIRNEAGVNPNHPAVTFYGEPKGEENKESGGGDEEKSKEDGDTNKV